MAWVLGDSFVFWGRYQLAEDLKAYPEALTAIRHYHLKMFGVRGLKLEKLPSLLQNKLDTEKVHPQVVIIHSGTNDINPHYNVNTLIARVSAVINDIKVILKTQGLKVPLIWSDVICRVAYKNLPTTFGHMLVTNMNAVAQMCMAINNDHYIQHPNIHPLWSKLFRNHLVSQDTTHLSPSGYCAWFKNIDRALRTFYPPVPLMEVSLPHD